MNVLPPVKEYHSLSGTFSINADSSIALWVRSSEVKNEAVFLRSSIKRICGFDLSVVVGDCTGNSRVILECGQGSEIDESYRMAVLEQSITIQATSPQGLFRGVTTLVQMIRIHGTSIPCCTISDTPDFSIRGVLHDVTRGKVPKLDNLKEIALKGAFYKINHLQLYIEHTFAFSMIPEYRTEFDPLTAEDIVELDDFCRKHYIDLVPAISTFGHLYELLRIKRFAHLNELDIDASVLPRDLWDRMAHYTIYPGSVESLELIQAMIQELLPLFSSRYINICADETFDLGKGKSKQEARGRGVGNVYAEFVNKLLRIVIDAGKIPMMWGDIICNHPEILPTFPKETVFLNWGYGADIPCDTTKQFADAGVNFLVCPGVQGWSRFANNINDASANIRKMVHYGAQCGASGILTTNWGDCGHVNFTTNSIHGIALGASLAWNKESFSQDSLFDKEFSRIEWGRGCECVAEWMRELGSLVWYHFGNMYAWIHSKECLWYKEEEVKNSTFESLAASLRQAVVIRNKLQGVSELVMDEQQQSFQECIWSASAISWTCSLLIVKKVVQFHQVSTVHVDTDMLLQDGKKLLDTFIVLWRRNNRESELQNIVDTFNAVFTFIEINTLANKSHRTQ